MRSAFNSYGHGVILKACPHCGAIPLNRCRTGVANPAHKARTTLMGWLFDRTVMDLVPVTQPFCQVIERRTEHAS